MKKILHVGCGQKNKAHLPAPFRSDDWQEVRYDVAAAVKPDIVGSITDMGVIGDGEFDALYSSNNIEHLFAHEVPVALREFSRVLKDDGICIITCPDIQTLGEAIAAGRITEPLYHSAAGPISPLDILYGHMASVARGNHYMAHKIGFTLQLLANTVHKCGFATVTGMREPNAYAVWVLAFKSTMLEADIVQARRRFLPG